MTEYNNVDDLLKTLFSEFSTTEDNIIKDYIAGKINRDEYIKRMEDLRERRRNKI